MVLEKLERSDKLLDRLHTDLEVQATKEVIKTLESNNLEPNAEQTVKSVQDAYKAASERYADALGIKQDAEVAKNLGYDSAWGKGIRLSLFGEHSGLNPQDMLKAVAKNGLRPGTIIATMTAAHENLASRLRSMDLLNALEQRDELAKELSKVIKVPVVTDSLIKTKATKPQIELSAQQRIENVKDAFEVKNFEQLNGKKIFLIDDVYTTGSTMEECAHVLRTSGVKSVWGIVIAREG